MYVSGDGARDEQYMPNVIQEVDRFGQGSMMVWGGMSMEGRTNLSVFRGNLTAAEYIEQILFTPCGACCILRWP